MAEAEFSNNQGEFQDEGVGYIKPIKIEEEVQSSYLDYAMSVIVSRALPDVRDGLKPVHRRILYAMSELGLRPTAKFRKSATVVGEVLGKYHPHGDVAVYDSMVGLAQDFKMRYPLITGQGNFGSIDGDSAAAMRYTEVKMAPITEEMLADIEKNTVDFMDNYDGTRKEPKVLPAKVPNLLLNGTLGIAVGMATNIPPHNIVEVADALICLLDNPQATVEDLLEFIKGPDFPTGGLIYNFEEIKEAYATGKGRILMRAVAQIEEKKSGFRIVITELPFQVNKAALVTRIAELIKEKKIVGVSELRDESDREGTRIVLDLKRSSYPNKILNQLYKYTPMQSVFHVNMLALVDGLEPRVLTLKMILDNFIKHRQEVVRRRCEYDLEKAKLRAHILEGLKKALDNLDAVIKTIKRSADREEAKVNLMKKFKLTEIQANAILEMKLQQLSALEREKIEEEYKEKKKLIKWLEDVLAHPQKILNLIKKELEEIKERYGDERKTKVVKGKVGELADEDLIPNEQVVVTITASNYIKRIPLSAYRAQHRGGKGVIGMATKEEDVIKDLIVARTHDDILFFTDLGRVFQLKVYELPATSRVSRGQALVNLLQLRAQETVTGIVSLSKDHKFKFLLMATQKGQVKKVKIEEFANIRRSGLIAIRLRKDDKLKWTCPTTGSDEVIIVTKDGQAIRFQETDIRPMGRSAAGVRGIRLKKGDLVVGMDVLPIGEIKALELEIKKTKKRGREPKILKDVLVVTERGYGKRTSIDQYHLQRRGGLGIKTAKITDKTGSIIGMEVVTPEVSQLIAISIQGQVIKVPIKAISRIGRATQGVRIMRLNSGDSVASICCAAEKGLDEVDEEKVEKISKPGSSLEVKDKERIKLKSAKKAKPLSIPEEKIIKKSPPKPVRIKKAKSTPKSKPRQTQKDKKTKKQKSLKGKSRKSKKSQTNLPKNSRRSPRSLKSKSSKEQKKVTFQKKIVYSGKTNRAIKPSKKVEKLRGQNLWSGAKKL